MQVRKSLGLERDVFYFSPGDTPINIGFPRVFVLMTWANMVREEAK